MPKAVQTLFWLALLLPANFSFSAETSIRMVRSLSGPSGKVAGGKFVLDEVRNRFVYPQDNALTVSFECKAPKGEYTLNVYWKDPQGRMAAISPDLKMQIPNEDLNSYWIFMLDAGKPSGIWTVELRVNGQPIGSHSFELFVPEPPKAPVSEAPAMPTLNELYSSISKSLVWLHKVGLGGIRKETLSGVVVAQNTILTSFQSIDAAMKIEVEFADGSRIISDEIYACNRMEGWALVKVATRDVPPVPLGKPESIMIGEQCIVFSVGPGASRTIGAVDIAGRRKPQGYGERVTVNPQLPWRAIGGPLLDLYGRIVGVVSGNPAPSSPGSSENAVLLPAEARYYSQVEIAPIDPKILQADHKVMILENLLGAGGPMEPLALTPVFVNGMTTDNVPAKLDIKSKSQFLRDESVIVYTNWKQKKKITNGYVSLKVYDAKNRLISDGKPQVMRLSELQMVQYVAKFSAAILEAGSYRLDICWNGLPVWRSFISIVDR